MHQLTLLNSFFCLRERRVFSSIVQMKTIILTTQKTEGESLRKRLSAKDVTFAEIPCLIKEDLQHLSSELVEVRYLFSTWNMPAFSAEEISSYFPNLQAVFYVGGTVKYFAEPFLNKGIKVFSAAAANGIPVAEYTVAQIVLANKGFFNAQKKSRSRLWRLAFNRARASAVSHPGNFNAEVGILGCGNVGRNVIRLLMPYRLSISIYDPYVSEEEASRLGVVKKSLAEIFSSCDVISNHLPNIPELNGVIDRSLLSRMKSTATLINTGRGAQIVEKDLAKVMRQKKDACAVLDVTCHEPPFPWSPLHRRNIFLTPHIAGSLSNEVDRMVEFILEAKDDLEAGKPNLCEVFAEQLKKQA